MFVLCVRVLEKSLWGAGGGEGGRGIVAVVYGARLFFCVRIKSKEPFCTCCA